MSARIQQLVDRLTKIADKDTRIVVKINDAVSRMAELGMTSEMVRKLLTENPSEGEILAGDKAFHGFASREQAGYAALAGLSKKEWPAALQAVHERVTALIRNQEPERADGGDSVMIMMPVVVVEQQPVKRFRRMRSGKIKELGPNGQEPIDVELEDVPVPATVSK